VSQSLAVTFTELVLVEKLGFVAGIFTLSVVVTKNIFPVLVAISPFPVFGRCHSDLVTGRAVLVGAFE